MEDDGMLMNFSVPVAGTERKQEKVTGGKWRDRRKLQLSMQGRSPVPSTSVNSSVIEKPRLSKEAKDSKSNTTKRPAVPSFGPSAKKIKFAEKGGEFGGNGSSYVSSLFTSNTANTLEISSDNTTHQPSNAPLDTSKFDGLGINEKLASHLTETLRFKHPTKVQRTVIPSMLNSQTDLFFKAQTGSGKTLSFLVPIFHKLMEERISRDSGLFAVILTPTRELANQIYGVMETLTRCCHHIVPGIVIGGEKKKSEKARLRKGVNILVATPGRLADHIENTESLKIGQLRWVILDEGDKLIELGFEETITKITDKITEKSEIWKTTTQYKGLPKERVNVLCSATMQDGVQKLGSIVLNNPKMVEDKEQVGTTSFETATSEENMTAPDQLIQSVAVVPPKLRLVALCGLLKRVANNKTIVFFSCSDSVNFHFQVFTRDGKKFKKVKNEDGTIEVKEAYLDDDEDEEEIGVMTAPTLGPGSTVFKLHGSMTQQARTSTLQSFIKDASNHSILFCTDVASRGLDLPNISNVIEYDPPFTVDDHLHRIGRSARVGNEGNATLFLLPGNEESYVDGKLKVVHPKKGSLRIIGYEDILRDGFAEVLEQEAPVKKSNDPKRKEGKWDIHATTWHLEVERWLLEDSTMHDRAVQAFTSHIRAYATHLSSERSFFNVKLLHLGHLAKSFGLRETPKKLGKSIGTTQNEGKKAKKEDPRKKMLRMAKMAVKSNLSEFNY
ncbi:DEAD-domain-containing protein [Suhomyces tanzawaensis NRRL Y-17324]|uniref:ATP-dependent RNA helicase n=1 Tax=Suhomyces tanzawaensis NRRL Y-17324 TaxID=984487 RepID=A0A1E4SRF6_9ASCO|nr:DEAD-domain-containing protein [Suhomyces tanzawaensis NRRL Y-17324]ODV82096.1 DEAD-domain-containing protein [Suhomyces tanzawaensis NRRL Y-17324]